MTPTSWVSPSGTKGDGDNWSYRNPHFRNLLGAEVGFEVSVNSYESGGKKAKIGYNTAGMPTVFWYTSFLWFIIFLRTNNKWFWWKRTSRDLFNICRYIGESGTLGGGIVVVVEVLLPNTLTDVTSSGATDSQAWFGIML